MGDGKSLSWACGELLGWGHGRGMVGGGVICRCCSALLRRCCSACSKREARVASSRSRSLELDA